jgi:uncharacterized protein
VSEQIRPAPRLTADDARMWDLLSTGRLHLQRCTVCEHVRFPPGPVCPACQRDRAEWLAVAGSGSVLSWVTFRRQYFDGIEPPHVVVAAELAEGPILLADFDGDSSVLALDLPVELVIAPARFDDGTTRQLYRWTARI